MQLLILLKIQRQKSMAHTACWNVFVDDKNKPKLIHRHSALKTFVPRFSTLCM